MKRQVMGFIHGTAPNYNHKTYLGILHLKTMKKQRDLRNFRNKYFTVKVHRSKFTCASLSFYVNTNIKQ